MRNLLIAGSAFILFLAGAERLPAANRIYIQNQSLKVGDKGVAVPVLCETDQVRHGFSLSIKYDQTKLSVTGVEIAGTASAGAEWSNGKIVAATGAISWGVVMDLSDPLDPAKVIPVGTDVVLVILRLDVTVTTAATAAITPQDGLGKPDGGWTNTLSYRGVTTRPSLAGGIMTIEALPPPGNRYQLGDCNGDKGAAPDLSDAIFLLTYLFLGGTAPACASACNADSSSGPLDLTDGIFILNYLFLSGTAPQAPFPACDTAPSADCGSDICGAQ